MLTTLGALRRLLLREFGVDDTLRNSAGFFMDGGMSSSHPAAPDAWDTSFNLGDPDVQEKDEDDEEQQKKSQPGARYADRHGST